MAVAPKKPVAKKPVAKKPVAKKPVAKAAVARPAVKKPAAAKKPAVKKPAVKPALAPYLAWCKSLIESGHGQVALEQVQAYVKANPGSASGLTVLAEAYRAVNDTPKAIECFWRADIVEPGNLEARRLHAETLAGEGDLAGAKALLYDTAQWHPTTASVLQDIAALTEGREDYVQLRRQWLAARLKGMKAAGGARAVAKAACLVDAFEDAREIYRWLIRLQIRRITAEKALNVIAPVKVSAGRVEDGKGERALHDLKALLREAETPFFLISGTLLGYLREGRMLPGDKDIDIGIFRTDYDYNKLEKAFRRSPVFVVKRLDNSDRLRVAHVNSVWIDVFPHYQEGDLIWHDGTASRWSNTPFEIGTMTVDGEEYEIPVPPERYLDENYGDWRTPNSLFDVRYEAPNSQVISQDYLSVLIYTKVFESLAANKWQVVEKYVADFPDMFRDDPALTAAAVLAASIADHRAHAEVALREGLPAPVFPEAQAAREKAAAARKAAAAKAAAEKKAALVKAAAAAAAAKKKAGAAKAVAAKAPNKAAADKAAAAAKAEKIAAKKARAANKAAAATTTARPVAAPRVLTAPAKGSWLSRLAGG